jgi:small-conductance mechanosensitive channel
VSDWAADFLTRWTRRIVIVAVTGIALANIGLLFGMYRTAQMAVLKLFSLLVHLCLVAAVLEARKPVAARLRARRTASGVWARLLNRFADIWHLVAIFYIVGLWLVWAVEVRNGYERLITFCAVTFAVLVGARLLGILVLGGLDRVRAVLVKDGYATVVDRAGVYYPVLRGVLTAVIWFITAIALLEAWGLPVLFWLTAGGLGGRVFDAMLTVVVAVLLAIVAWEGANAAIARHLAALSSSSQLARAGRLRTLLPFLRTALLITILLIVGMIVLSAIGVNIAPLLAGAGVIGIAVGFGSQKLVQDLITGLFLLLENAMQVGDVVTVAGMTGTVEALSIRTIRLRALDGAVHLIPFSSVTTVTNQTRDYSYAVLDVAVGLNEEPGPVEQVLRDVGAEMQADPDWQSMVLDKLDVLGVEKLGDTAWTLRVRMKTQPGSRWAVARELNRRIKVRFDQLAIESPFTSHRVLSRDAPPPQVASPEEQAA